MSIAEQPGLEIVNAATRSTHQGIVGVFAKQWAIDPRRPRMHVVDVAGSDVAERSLSFADIFESAGRAAFALEAAGARSGDRVLISLSDPRLFLAWFLGALGRGLIAVPAPPLEELGASAQPQLRIGGILAQCAPRVAITENAAAFERAVPETVATLLEGSAIDLHGPTLELEDPAPKTPAFLQYTSGSTGTPKGVVVTHANLVANLEAICVGMGISDKERMFSWLPLHHDMGLIGGILWPLFAGSEAYVMKPLTFITKPMTWLESITRFAISVILAPNFAYSICARKIPDRHLNGVDLSSVRVAICGAEPIDISVVRAFIRRFATYGFDARAFYPVYGLAEATLGCSIPDRGAGVRVDVVDRRRLAGDGRAELVPEDAKYAQTLISVGKALPGHAIEIRAVATGITCGERQVGEVMVRGPSLSPRYWTEAPDTRRDILATGDLGYLADGELYLVDRLKDLVIIAGQNYAPSDIETAATEGTAARKGRVIAFSDRRPETGTEAAIVVAEVDPGETTNLDAIRAAIESAVRARIGIQCEVVLTTPGSIEKTTSGKLRRSACAARYAEGTLPIVGNREGGR